MQANRTTDASIGYCEIPAPRLNLVTLFRPDLNLVEAAVSFGVQRHIACVVLAAEFVGNLLKCGL
jgi:hypothetical protein